MRAVHRERSVPVRPSTLVTLTSLTGIFPESMIVARFVLGFRWIGDWWYGVRDVSRAVAVLRSESAIAKNRESLWDAD